MPLRLLLLRLLLLRPLLPRPLLPRLLLPRLVLLQPLLLRLPHPLLASPLLPRSPLRPPLRLPSPPPPSPLALPVPSSPRLATVRSRPPARHPLPATLSPHLPPCRSRLRPRLLHLRLPPSRWFPLRRRPATSLVLLPFPWAAPALAWLLPASVLPPPLPPLSGSCKRAQSAKRVRGRCSGVKSSSGDSKKKKVQKRVSEGTWTGTARGAIAGRRFCVIIP